MQIILSLISNITLAKSWCLWWGC